MNDVLIDMFVREIREKMRLAENPDIDRIVNELKASVPGQNDAIDKAYEKLKEQIRSIRTLKDPLAIISNETTSWYAGPQENDLFWPNYYKTQAEKIGRDSADSMDRVTSRILSCMSHPGAPSIRTRGLVLGYVQSGKTANFIGLTAKAADVGYKLIIVMTGTIEKLRRQTQRRIAKDLISQRPNMWFELTSDLRDFIPTNNVDAFLTQHSEQHIVAVVKKNGPILKNLITWLEGANPITLRACPTLIIDDEADQASINTARTGNPSRINDRIRRLLGVMPKSAYVGYTATPFANLLIDASVEDDLYPRDFIIDMPKPPAYFGPERVFGRDPLDMDEGSEDLNPLDVIREVSLQESGLLTPPSRDIDNFFPQMTESLRAAIRHFVLATAARYARGQTDEASSMLIHTSYRGLIHNRTKPLVETEISEIRTAFETKSSLLNELKLYWESEALRVQSDDAEKEPPVDFNQLAAFVPEVLSRLKIVIENSISDETLDYRDQGEVYIAIGGNILSRGLTLDGLTVSYFTRRAATYDTLLQMGRWFGYRPGYWDLTRVWMTDDLRGFFYDLATVEQEIRYDIEKYVDGSVTPKQFGPLIRTHPVLDITAQAKMRTAQTAFMSFGGRRLQTIKFNTESTEAVQNNINVTRNLAASVSRLGIKFEERPSHSGFIAKGVPSNEIIAFMNAYSLPVSVQEIKPTLIAQYIEKMSHRFNGALSRWNVVFFGLGERTRSDGLGSVDLGLPAPVWCVNRSKLRHVGHTDIKALMSVQDIIADYPELASSVTGNKDFNAFMNARSVQDSQNGLIIIYPISKNSAPAETDSKSREALNAPDHLMGFGLIFPRIQGDAQIQYMTAFIPPDALPDAEPELEEEAA